VVADRQRAAAAHMQSSSDWIVSERAWPFLVVRCGLRASKQAGTHRVRCCGLLCLALPSSSCHLLLGRYKGGMQQRLCACSTVRAALHCTPHTHTGTQPSPSAVGLRAARLSAGQARSQGKERQAIGWLAQKSDPLKPMQCKLGWMHKCIAPSFLLSSFCFHSEREKREKRRLECSYLFACGVRGMGVSCVPLSSCAWLLCFFLCIVSLHLY
jgi:hypothetical protein